MMMRGHDRRQLGCCITSGTPGGCPKISRKIPWKIWGECHVKSPSNHIYIYIHPGKSTWHRSHVLVYIGPILTCLLGSVPCIFTLSYIDL